MFTIHVKLSNDLKRKLNPAQFQKVAQDGTLMVAKELEADARPYPGPAAHPIQWASEKQRRAYFARRREAGLPPGYTRQSDPMSQRLMNSYVVAPLGYTGARLSNSATYAPYVIGEQQQPFHKNTGWKKLYDVAADFVASGKVQRIFNAIVQRFFHG